MKRLYRWLPAFLWMLVIFGLSHQTGSELETFLPWFQRWLPWMKSFDIGHLISYFILACLIWWAIGSYRISAQALVVFLCFLYGVTDEYHQSFVPGRTPEFFDLFNDTIGAILAMLFVRLPWIRKRFEKFKK